MTSRTLFISTIALGTLPFVANSVQASTNTEGYVNTAYLNVRSNPNINDNSIGSLSNQSKVTILGENKNWYKIQYNNQEAYVNKEYITVSSTKYKVTADALRVRSEASTNSPVVDLLDNGEIITVVSENNGWCKIIHNNQTSYVNKAFLTPVSNSENTTSNTQSVSQSIYYVNADSLRLRTGPGINYNTTDVISNGEAVTVTGQSGEWYKVSYNGTDGYVMKEYVSSSKSASSHSSNTFGFPASSGIITAYFGPRAGGFHYGIDIAGPGSVQIYAAASGTVTRSYYSSSYGNVVFLTHTINGQLYTTVYAHMKNRYVSEGDTVKQGQVLGYMGSTGDATGQHLHFELHKGTWNYAKTNAVDPLPFIQH